MGDKRVGWIVGEDIAAVAARVLAEGPERHAGKQYWLSTEVLNGSEAAAEIAQALQQKVECAVMTPDDLAALIASGALQPPPNIEANYAASMIEWARQTCDGRMDFGAITTPMAEELLGRKPLTLRAWVERNSQAVLEAGARAVFAARTPTNL
jgi:NAD(P)H dehydrogenase (quinone)